MDTLGFEPVDLLDEGFWIEHHAIADDRQLASAHHARRQQRQLVRDAVNDKGVAGIVATLKAHDDVGLLGQPINDLALSFVSPLGAHHDHIGHATPFLGAADARDSLAETMTCRQFGRSPDSG